MIVRWCWREWLVGRDLWEWIPASVQCELFEVDQREDEMYLDKEVSVRGLDEGEVCDG